MDGQEKDYNVKNRIITINQKQYVLDFDLANFYGMETRVFNQTVKRNKHRFRSDFIIELSKEETDDLFKLGFIKKGTGGKNHNILAFSMEAVVLLCGMLSSNSAVEKAINVAVDFVQMKQRVIEEKKDNNNDRLVTFKDLEIFSENIIKLVEETLKNNVLEKKQEKTIGFLPESLKNNKKD